MVRNILFDFATKFARENNKIPAAKEFKITDELYTSFSDFVLAEEFEYTTNSIELMKQLEEAADYENSMDDVQAEYDALLKKLTPSKASDLVK